MLTKLTDLQLTHSSIDLISVSALTGLHRLQKNPLDASGGETNTVVQGALTRLRQLTHLQLCIDGLTDDTVSATSSMQQLQYLEIDYNRLYTWEEQNSAVVLTKPPT